MNYFTNKQIFYINSARRLTGTHSNFSYFLNIDPNEEFDRVVVLAASIPKSYYLVDSTYKSFTLQESSSTVTINFSVGNYTRNSLGIKLQSLLNTNSPNNYTYSVSYSNISTTNDNGKYTITVSGNGGVQPIFIFTNQMYEQLGFDLNSSNQFSGGILESTNVVNLTNETTLFIHSDICQNNEGNNILQEIYASGEASYSMINFTNPIPLEYSKPMNTTFSKSSSYNFYLTDENGTSIDTNGININMTIMIYKKNDIDRMIKGAIKYYAILSGKEK